MDISTLYTNKNSEVNITKREKEILKLIGNGLNYIEIAKFLFISKNTVRTHRQNIMIKLGAKNVAELIKIATNEGYI